MSNYREQIEAKRRQLKIFLIIRIICSVVLAISFIGLVAWCYFFMDKISIEEILYGTSSVSLEYLTLQVCIMAFELSFDGLVATIILSSIWKFQIRNREAKLAQGINSDIDVNAQYDYAEPKEEKKPDPLSDYTNPDDPFH